jgi:ABC-type dipeptide/oligopeptide/nickel transport system ATPase component
MPYDIITGRNSSDKKSFVNKGLAYIGKGYVKMGQYTSLSNKIFMDIIRSHVVLVAGKRGSGKSYTLGVIAEELSNLPKEVSQNIASLIFDTMGIYWTMKYANEKDKELLQEWGLKPKNLKVKVFVPYGFYEEYTRKGIPADEKFALDVCEMNAEDWILTFGLDIINPVAVLIERTIIKLKEKKI